MEKAGRHHQIMAGGGGGGMKKVGPAAAPAMGLQKQNSWSPDIERDEAWERRRRGMRRGGSALRRVRSVTDDDLDELRGCIDLGFGFEPPAARTGCPACGGAGRSRLLETLPALDLYYAVHGGGGGGAEGCSCGAASEVSSEESPLGSPMSILAPGDTPETVKMRLKQWAQVVALSMLTRH
ncbi:hypothetical protein SEVIR_1G338200v4 [Setaria viridis]|uniref:Uncharacterized protein n=2 Tax=Setaria TaxID=4554 RepID=K3YW10_SETIT|nr:uncharacterized protein LOC101778045 [Setaria italica]XP_034575528.1 uncharacterized protein LOC117839331 [Setaria viridis]RCV08500.1 hypothetical protein SETIT_1G331500v2 [Setaria italica]TKW41751.1 hypothetical protein SEVIR_1G338200v2 [Setaria viridis]